MNKNMTQKIKIKSINSFDGIPRLMRTIRTKKSFKNIYRLEDILY